MADDRGMHLKGKSHPHRHRQWACRTFSITPREPTAMHLQPIHPCLTLGLCVLHIDGNDINLVLLVDIGLAGWWWNGSKRDCNHVTVLVDLPPRLGRPKWEVPPLISCTSEFCISSGEEDGVEATQNANNKMDLPVVRSVRQLQLFNDHLPCLFYGEFPWFYALKTCRARQYAFSGSARSAEIPGGDVWKER
ncbi:hypothetical protein B0H10DRAFT_2203688 [Mycena sp. CBHHK59/15]|nr:hypothetical protein B0H10DRAFT_2203688 [Mycena sp. CBHHK59/15]